MEEGRAGAGGHQIDGGCMPRARGKVTIDGGGSGVSVDAAAAGNGTSEIPTTTNSLLFPSPRLLSSLLFLNANSAPHPSDLVGGGCGGRRS